MPTLIVVDPNGWTSRTEDATPVVSYNPGLQQVRLAVGGVGRSATLDLDPAAARALINELMQAVHQHKLATKRRQPPQKLLRRQANKPRPIPTVR